MSPEGGNRRENRQEPKQDELERQGVVQEALPKAMFRVRCESGQSVLATVSGSLRHSSIKLLPGDRVTIELSPYDPNRGRITFRHK